MSIKDQRGITTFWGISIILMEAVVVFFVFYTLYFFWIENPTPTSNILIMKVFKPGSSIDIPDEVDTDGWLSYQNNSYNFSLKYPTGYDISEDSLMYGEYEGKSISFNKPSEDSFGIRIFKVMEEEKIADTYERLTGVDPSIYQHVVMEVAGIEAAMYRTAPGDLVQDKIYFVNDGSLFEVSYHDFAAQILSTFKFNTDGLGAGDMVIESITETKIIYSQGSPINLAEDDCGRRSGEFNSCGSLCQPGVICAAVCVPICNL